MNTVVTQNNDAWKNQWLCQLDMWPMMKSGDIFITQQIHATTY